MNKLDRYTTFTFQSYTYLLFVLQNPHVSLQKFVNQECSHHDGCFIAIVQAYVWLVTGWVATPLGSSEQSVAFSMLLIRNKCKALMNVMIFMLRSRNFKLWSLPFLVVPFVVVLLISMVVVCTVVTDVMGFFEVASSLAVTGKTFQR